MTIHTIDVSPYPANERPFRAVQHWKTLYPESTSVRIGVDNGIPTIAANQFGDRLEVKGLNHNSWSIDFLWRHQLKIDDPQIKTFADQACKLYDKGDYRNPSAIVASTLGLIYKPWLKPSVLETINELKKSESYISNSRKNIQDRILHDIQYVLDRLNAGFNVKKQENEHFQWESATRYGSNTATEKMIEDVKGLLPLNTRNFVQLNTTGGEFELPESLFEWELIPAHLAEETLMAAKRVSIVEGLPLDEYAKSLYKPENFTWVRNSFLQGDTEQVLLSDDKNMYAMGSTGDSITPNTPLVQEGLELLDLAQQGQLSAYHAFNTIAPDVITSFAIHLHEKAIRLEKEALHPPEFKTPPENQPIFPTPIADLRVGGYCAAGHGDNINWCRVIAKKDNIATLWIINGEWAFDIDVNNGKTLPHAIANGYVEKIRILSTSPTPYEGVDSHYNQAIDYYKQILNLQHKDLDLNAAP